MSDHLMRMGKSTLADDMRAAGFDVKVEKGDGPIQGLGLTGVIMDEAIEPAPERKPIVARQAEIDAAERRIWSDAGVSEYAPIDPAAWRGLSGTVGHLFQPTDKRALTEIKYNEHQRPVVRRLRDDSADALTYLFQPTEEQVERAKSERSELESPRDYLRRLQVEQAKRERDAFYERSPFESVQVKKEVPPPLPAKPVLLIPDGCTLVIPDDVSPWEFLSRYDTSQMGPGALVVNRSGLATLEKHAEQRKAEAAETRRTHAALTFEQPIQNRLGRMAK